MTHCRTPFACDTASCDRCNTPVITLPPTHEPLRSKMAMIAFTGALFSILALCAFSGVLDRLDNVNRQYQEVIKMIASVIAYGMCAIFMTLGLATISLILGEKLSSEKYVAYFIVGMIFLALAWGCAYLGGI